MPTPNGPQFKKLYHGSREGDFEPGQTVDPRKYHGIKQPVAFATPHKKVAESFANDGRVYEVELLEEDEPYIGMMRNYPGKRTEVVSERGFRVIKRLTSGDPNANT